MSIPQGAALITGASAGLGAIYAELFAADGHDVILVARRQDRLDTLADTLRDKHSIQATVIAADLAQPDSPQHIFDTIKAANIDVAYVVNNAGFGDREAFKRQSIDRILGMIHVNMTSLTHLTYLFVNPMIERGGGRILNIGSTAGFQPGPYMAVYYASKAYVNSFSEALAFELRNSPVSVTVSCPGATGTEFATVAGNDKTPIFKRKTATAEDVAREGYHAMHAGKVMIVHGMANKIAIHSLRYSPRSLVRSVAARLNSD